MAKTVRDCAILLEAMAGFDPKDSTSLDAAGAAVGSGLVERSQGQARRYSQGISHRRRARRTSTLCGTSGIEWLRDAGAEPVEISLPHTKYALPTYYIIAPAEASSNLARYDGVRYGMRGRGREDARRHVCRDPRRGLRRRGQAPDHDRHLCAVGRLLRRLFHQGAAGAGADQAGFRPRVRAVRPDPDPDRADAPPSASARPPTRWRCI